MVIGEKMKKALISTTETNIQYVSGWTESNPPQAIYSIYPNSCRVAQVSDTEFEVYHTLIWIDCADNVVADEFYYDTTDKTIKPIINAPYPSV
jgi:hypothetical protein